MSKMLEQAIVDAEALKEAALKNAEQTILEKYSQEIRSTVETLLEQPMPMSPEEEMMMGAPEEQPLLDQVPLAATDGETLCPCPDEEETVEINFSDLHRMANQDQEPAPGPDMMAMGGMPPEAAPMAPMGPEAGMMPPEEEEPLMMMEVRDDDGEYIIIENDRASMQAPNSDGPITDYLHGYGKMKEEEIQEKLKNPEKADLDDDGELSSYEKKRGSAIEKAMAEEIEITEEDLAEIVEALVVDAKPVPSGVPGGGTNNADLEEYVDEAIAQEENELEGALVPGKGIRVNHQAEEALSENKELKVLNNKYENRLKELNEQNDKYKDLLGKLKTRLEEINLVNAKLLYTNRTLSNVSLNERQKNKIADAISEVQSVEEARVVYETLQSTVGTRPQKRAPQSLSEAVKRSSTTLPRRKSVAKTSDSVSDRWKILAGIKDKN